MRINKFIAQNSHLSRRQADEAIKAARVTINSKTALIGDSVTDNDVVTLDNKILSENLEKLTILLNKPVGYVCSRNGQGNPTVYDLLPKKYHNLNIAGRLDKDSSGLVILTSDGELLYELTHPSKNKEKVYEVQLDKQLTREDLQKLNQGVDIGDKRPSVFKSIKLIGDKKYQVILEEGRNRQIRRTLEKLDKRTIKLHRTQLGTYDCTDLRDGAFRIV